MDRWKNNTRNQTKYSKQYKRTRVIRKTFKRFTIKKEKSYYK